MNKPQMSMKKMIADKNKGQPAIAATPSHRTTRP
jgi:hypothetical protein